MIDQPGIHHVPQLKRLWKEVFGDEDAFLDLFFEKAWSSDRCLCAFDGDTVKGMLHWLPCTLEGKRFAYLYALGVLPAYRNRGNARRLMAAARRLLEMEGWAGILLLPQEEGLRSMYEKLGYETACFYNEGISGVGSESAPLHRITGSEYTALREKRLPAGGVIQEEPFLSLLEKDLKFYRGVDFLLAVREETDHLFALELLGNTLAAPGILAALGHTWGRFRTPGSKQPGAMYMPLDREAPVPRYLAFDML